MLKLLKLFFICFLILATYDITYAQVKKLPVNDRLLQDSIYKSNKKKVLNFSMKEFDALFFEYFNRKNNPNVTLTKTEFYTYTVQIATFSDRLAHYIRIRKKLLR